MSILIGLGIGGVLATIFCWLTGGFNPIGYLGVPPWRVPRCKACGRKDGVFHKYECTGGAA